MTTSTQTEPAALPRAGRRLAAIMAWRPSVRLAVAGAALAIVVGDSETVVPKSLADLLAGELALNLHVSAEEMGT